MFERYFTETCIVKRTEKVIGTDKSRFQLTGNEYKGKVTRDSYHDKTTGERVLSSSYTLSLNATNTDIDIKDSDHIIVEGIEYVVKGTPNLSKGITFNIMEVLIKKTDNGTN